MMWESRDASTWTPATRCLTWLLTVCAIVGGTCVVRAAGEASGRPALDPPRAKILLLGTFHFKDAGLDSYKPEFDVDIFSEKRQKEVADVVRRLSAYRPTKIAAEWRPEHQEATDDPSRDSEQERLEEEGDEDREGSEADGKEDSVRPSCYGT